MKTFAPNYTQIPNALIDGMAELSDAELRVALAICRQTFGWHRERAVLSQTFLAKATGQSTVACSKAGTSLASRGIVEKAKHRGSNMFALVVEALPEPINAVNGHPLTPLTEGDNAVNRPPVNAVNTKKERATKKDTLTGGVSNPTFRFVSLWARDYVAKFRRTYDRQPRDYAAAKRLLSSINETPENLIQVAVLAWAQTGPKFWACVNKTSTVVDFCANYNRIATELGVKFPKAVTEAESGPKEFA